MCSEIKVYTREDGEMVLELWGASTKHPDSVFYFKDFKKQEILPDDMQVFQWLLECASKLTWPFHAKKLTEYALKNWYKWD